MVLYLDEFISDVHEVYGKVLRAFEPYDKYLHELKLDVILEEINGTKSFYRYKAALNMYLKWLNDKYGIDTIDIYYDLNHVCNSNNFEYIGFLTFEDLYSAIHEAELVIESDEDNGSKDYTGLIALFYLEWLGIKMEDFISIRLNDVTNMGKTVYVPSLDKSINIENEIISDYLWSYKNTHGRQRDVHSKAITPYKQNTLYRTIRNGEVSIKTIYNVRQRFVKASGDERFAKKRVWYSGVYYRTYQRELKECTELKYNNEYSFKVVGEMMNIEPTQQIVTMFIREFRAYKKLFMKTL